MGRFFTSPCRLLVQVVSAEIFPSRVRSLTGAFSAMSCWLGSFSSTEAFPYMIASGLGVWGSFLFFSVCCFLTTWVLALVTY